MKPSHDLGIRIGKRRLAKVVEVGGGHAKIYYAGTSLPKVAFLPILLSPTLSSEH